MNFLVYSILLVASATLGKRYKYLTYPEFILKLESLEEDFPSCVRVFDALVVWPELAREDVCNVKLNVNTSDEFPPM